MDESLPSSQGVKANKTDVPKMRAFDKVYTYLEQHLKVGEKTVNFRLPPIREISRKSGVSPSSARNVLLDLAGQGQVEIFPGSGAFWISNPQRKKEELVIGVNTFANPGQEEVARRRRNSLYGGMVRGAIKGGIEIKFKPVSFDLAAPEAIDLKQLQKTVKGADCFFFHYPSPFARNVATFLEGLSIPCIFFNPISPTETVNFLSADYYGAARLIGRVWGRTGRKRILMLQAPGAYRSTSCQLLYAGLTAGLGIECDLLPEVHRLNVAENACGQGYRAFREFVARTGKAPDAVHCTADELAMGVLNAAEELGIDIPTEMSVIGGNGMSRDEPVNNLLLTATEQPVEEIGENFIFLFQKRSANQMRDVPGLYFPMRMLIGQSTRPEESELLASGISETQ